MLPKISNVGKLYATQLISSSVAIFTLFAVMFTERGGLTSSQVGLLFGVFALTTLVSEVPTGVLADKFSRKWAIVISKLLLASGMLAWLLAPSFFGYLIGIILMGIGESMSSGAVQAYLYESCGVDKKHFTRINTRLWTMRMTGYLVSTALAIPLIPNYNKLLVLSVIAPLIGMLIALTLDSDRKVRKRTAEVVGIKSFTLFVQGVKYVTSTKTILLPVLSLVLLQTIVSVQIENIPLYYRDSGVSIEHLPSVFFIGNAISIVIFWNGQKLAKLLKRREIVYGSAFLIAMLSTSRIPVFPAVLGMFWLVRFDRLLYIFHDGEIQHQLVDKHRATVTSTYSMLGQLLTAVSFVVIGVFADGSSGIVMPVAVFSTIGLTTYFALQPKNT